MIASPVSTRPRAAFASARIWALVLCAWWIGAGPAWAGARITNDDHGESCCCGTACDRESCCCGPKKSKRKPAAPRPASDASDKTSPCLEQGGCGDPAAPPSGATARVVVKFFAWFEPSAPQGPPRLDSQAAPGDPHPPPRRASRLDRPPDGRVDL